MAPEILAAAIYTATVRRQSVLIPGFANRVFALAGRWAPGISAWVMRKTLYEKLV